MRMYRGKVIKAGGWVYGYFFQIWEKTYILWGTTNDVPNMTEVIPDTVGQSTGRSDINKKEVYGGDIVKAWIYVDETPLELEVHWHGAAWVIDYPSGDYDCVGLGYFAGSIEIIGTIHDKEQDHE